MCDQKQKMIECLHNYIKYSRKNQKTQATTNSNKSNRSLRRHSSSNTSNKMIMKRNYFHWPHSFHPLLFFYFFFFFIRLILFFDARFNRYVLNIFLSVVRPLLWLFAIGSCLRARVCFISSGYASLCCRPLTDATQSCLVQYVSHIVSFQHGTQPETEARVSTAGCIHQNQYENSRKKNEHHIHSVYALRSTNASEASQTKTLHFLRRIKTKHSKTWSGTPLSAAVCIAERIEIEMCLCSNSYHYWSTAKLCVCVCTYSGLRFTHSHWLNSHWSLSYPKEMDL